jgi:hypothetical protein
LIVSQATNKTHLLVPRDEAQAKLIERMQRAADIRADDISRTKNSKMPENVRSDGVSTTTIW